MAVQKLLEDVKVPPLALAVVVTFLTIGYFAGVTLTKITAADDLQKLQHEHALKLHEHALKMQELRHEFALDEVGGVRSDMTREDQHLQKQIDELKTKHNGNHP